jgi:protein KTI12
MPLIIVCGLPCSGKTRISEELKAYFAPVSKHVHTISDHDHHNSDRNVAYEDSRSEKELRGSLKATVERLLSKESVVILDSLNYIKGYRYELYCVAKHNKTQHCVVYSATPVDKCREWNEAREPSERYNSELLDSLAMRFEEPDSRNRWDNPLFTIVTDDKLPLERIKEALFEQKPPKPNQSTQTVMFSNIFCTYVILMTLLPA